ncbi:MAG: ABC transporter permease [Tissierellia bacterium]|jgi:simple sugar transport system permease protein|nr:ABC transporter permease [Bacillota bacterium]NLK57750.1 ABC transporter permease [Tissierellia bacterium]
MIVPIVFMIICAIGFYFSGLTFDFITTEMIFRLSRNLLLVASLIIPVISGMGLNFGIVIGAMAGQIGLIFIMNFEIGGMLGLFVAMLISIPFSIFFGYLVGLVLNRAKGKEMITSMILGFFANGIYQLVFIILVGRVIPMSNPNMLMESGFGLRNTVDLFEVRKAFDNWIFGGLTNIPVMPLVFSALIFVFIYLFFKTKLGQDMRAIGQDMHVAEVAGIHVDKTRLKAIIISTVLAGWGQIMYLQNLGTLNTYTNHEQVGLFAVAALLIGGATVEKATWKEAVLGTFLFHLLFVVSPLAGQQLMGDAQIGEYFRVFVAYGVIGFALILHAMEKRKRMAQDLQYRLEQQRS